MLLCSRNTFIVLRTSKFDPKECTVLFYQTLPQFRVIEQSTDIWGQEIVSPGSNILQEYACILGKFPSFCCDRVVGAKEWLHPSTVPSECSCSCTVCSVWSWYRHGYCLEVIQTETGNAWMKSILERKLYSPVFILLSVSLAQIHRVTSCATSSCLILPGSVIDAGIDAYPHLSLILGRTLQLFKRPKRSDIWMQLSIPWVLWLTQLLVLEWYRCKGPREGCHASTIGRERN